MAIFLRLLGSECTLPGSKPQRKLFLPELMHNVKLLIDQTEQDIVQTDRKLHYNRDLLVNLAHEKEQREAQMKDDEEQIDKLTQILKTIEMSVLPEAYILCENIYIAVMKESRHFLNSDHFDCSHQYNDVHVCTHSST